MRKTQTLFSNFLMELCQNETKGSSFAIFLIHEASSDWDAGEKVLKPDEAYNSFFKGQTIPKGWERLQGDMSSHCICLVAQ